MKRMKALFSRLILIEFLLLLFSDEVISQPCNQTNYLFTNQNQIDSFPINNPNCDEVLGNLRIDQEEDTLPVNNLTGLAQIRRINGDLSIRNSNIKNFIGLDSLMYVGGDFAFSNNDSLSQTENVNSLSFIGRDLRVYGNKLLGSFIGFEGINSVRRLIIIQNENLINLRGLENIDTVYGHFNIRYNHALEDLDGLTNIKYVGGIFWIEKNDQLKDLEGIMNINKIGGNAMINYNPSLISLEGLESLSFIDGFLEISHNESIETVSGLENLSKVDGALWFNQNPQLNSLTSLTNLQEIYGTLWIKNNISLTSLSGLENIADSTMFDLFIEESPNLSFCSIQSICNYLEGGGDHSVFGNAPSCSSAQSILDECDMISNQSLNLKEAVKIYPNPVNEKLIIDTDRTSKLRFEVLDIYGRQVLKGMIEGQTILDLSDKSNGTYILWLYEDNISTKMLFIKN